MSRRDHKVNKNFIDRTDISVGYISGGTV